MLKVLAICVLFAVVLASAERTRWHQLTKYSFEKYVEEFGKKYASKEEFNMRKNLFESKLRDINMHNANPVYTWKRGVNHLSDRTEQEFNKLLGYRKDIAYAMKASKPARTYNEKIDVSALPASVDWRQKGVVTSVKDQGGCGSCWSFGTAESLESFYAIATGQLTDFSEQQVLDCTPNPNECGGTGGCQGGTVELAYTQIMKSGGISTEWTYPYVSYFGKNFQCGSITPFATLTNYTDLPSNEQPPLLQAIANDGPMAISVDASTWFDYETGVYDGCNQTNPDIDHSVQLVGYGTDTQLGDYWLIRNSWSPAWGEDGYIRIRREQTPRCGTDITPSDGTGCKNGPPSVKVCGTCGILYDSVIPTIATTRRH